MLGKFWGSFSLVFPFRVGYNCQQFYEKIKKGKQANLSLEDLKKEPKLNIDKETLLSYPTQIWQLESIESIVSQIDQFIKSPPAPPSKTKKASTIKKSNPSSSSTSPTSSTSSTSFPYSQPNYQLVDPKKNNPKKQKKSPKIQNRVPTLSSDEQVIENILFDSEDPKNESKIKFLKNPPIKKNVNKVIYFDELEDDQVFSFDDKPLFCEEDEEEEGEEEEKLNEEENLFQININSVFNKSSNSQRKFSPLSGSQLSKQKKFASLLDKKKRSPQNGNSPNNSIDKSPNNPNNPIEKSPNNASCNNSVDDKSPSYQSEKRGKKRKKKFDALLDEKKVLSTPSVFDQNNFIKSIKKKKKEIKQFFFKTKTIFPPSNLNFFQIHQRPKPISVKIFFFIFFLFFTFFFPKVLVHDYPVPMGEKRKGITIEPYSSPISSTNPPTFEKIKMGESSDYDQLLLRSVPLNLRPLKALMIHSHFQSLAPSSLSYQSILFFFFFKKNFIYIFERMERNDLANQRINHQRNSRRRNDFHLG